MGVPVQFHATNAQSNAPVQALPAQWSTTARTVATGWSIMRRSSAPAANGCVSVPVSVVPAVLPPTSDIRQVQTQPPVPVALATTPIASEPIAHTAAGSAPLRAAGVVNPPQQRQRMPPSEVAPLAPAIVAPA